MGKRKSNAITNHANIMFMTGSVTLVLYLMKQESVSHLKKGLHIIFTLYGMHWETKILLMQ